MEEQSSSSKRDAKRFCPYGHDTFVVGRGRSRCRECLRQSDRKRDKSEYRKDYKRRLYHRNDQYRKNKLEGQRRYLSTPEGKAVAHRKAARYNATFKGYRNQLRLSMKRMDKRLDEAIATLDPRLQELIGLGVDIS